MVVALRKTFKHGQLISYAAAALGIDMVWATVTGFLPPMLERFGASPSVIGILMGVGPATGLIVQPLAGLLSDGVGTRLGRRLPFILIGAPIASLSLLGLGRAVTLAMVALFLSLLCIAVNSYHGPYRAILGDEIAPEQHALTSSFQNLFSGFGMILAFTAGAWLVRHGNGLPFYLTALMVFATTAWTCAVMRKESSSQGSLLATDQGLLYYLRGARSLRWLLGAQFCWWFAIQAASAFAVLYTVHDLKGIRDITSPEGKAAAADAVLLLATVTVTVLAAAVPVGLFAQAYGKKQVLSAGLIVMALGFSIAGFATSIIEIYLVMVMFGLGFACVQVIPFTMLTELQPRGREGALAGVFNIFIALPQLLSLAIVGALIERVGSYRVAFWVGSAALLLALVALQKVRGQRSGVRDQRSIVR